MFLKKIFSWILVLVVSSPFLASAVAIEVLESGDFKLSSGNKEQCADFRLSPDQIKGEVINISQRYSFKVKNKKSDIPSDLDKNCVFKEESTREDTGIKQTILKRVNKEICSGKVRSMTKSTLTLTRGEILLQHQVDGAEPYECVWKKK